MKQPLTKRRFHGAFKHHLKIKLTTLFVFTLIFNTRANTTSDPTKPNILTENLTNNNIPFASKAQNQTKVSTQKLNISGIITDINNQPLPGATVLEKGTTNGAQSDFDGRFSLQISNPNAVLVVSYIGFKTQEISIGNQTQFNIKLEEDSAVLDEVVVVGYGTQQKANVTGAVSQISGEKLQSRPVTNVSAALQGQIPGVTVQAQGGAPGANSAITIRGLSSLNGGGALVIVDGIPGNLNNVNPDDIESISVLKDGASAAIYGSRASGGVILITTKKGKTGKTTVTYNGNSAIQTPTIVPKQLDPIDSAIYGNLAFANAGRGTLYPQYVLDALNDPNVSAVANTSNTRDFFFTGDFDWTEHFYNSRFQQNHSLSIAGGSEQNTYNISASWLDQDGYFSKWGPDNFDRYTFRVNLSNKLIPEKLTLNTNISLTSNDRLQSSLQAGVIQSVFQAGRNQEIYDPNGNYSRYRFQQNTLQLLQEAGFDEDKTHRMEGRLGLNWNVTKEFSVETLLGYNIQWQKGTLFGRGYYKHNTEGDIVDPNGVPRWVNQPTRVILNNGYNRFYTTQAIARYKKSFNKHNIEVLVGASAEESYNETNSTQRFNINGNELAALNLGDPDTAQNSFGIGEWGILSQFGRAVYSFDNKYIVEGTFRRDGSSRFSDENKWGFFPSVLAAWRVSNESFMQNIKAISNLKLKASYGETGNQSGIGLYDHINTITPTGNLLLPDGGGIQPIYRNPQLASQDRTWETVKSFNYGIELGFLSNRLQGEFNYFVKRNENMLINIDVPSIIGIGVPTNNNGELETKGWDAQISWTDTVESIGLKYSIGANIFDQTDKIVSLDQETVNLGTGIRNLQGYPSNGIFGFRTNGIYRTQEQFDNGVRFNNGVEELGDIEYVDIDGDGQVSNNPDDIAYIGDLKPRYVYGFNFSAEWKNFDFSAFFQGVGKRNYYLNADAVGPFRNPWDNWAFAELGDYWTPDNVNAKYPRPLARGTNFRFSDFWMQDASYIRLKNLQVGYNLAEKHLSKIGFKSFRIYFSGENLWEKTNLILFDPEINSLNGRAYPLNRSYSLGINVSL
ncbi:SusC/RagA family TonB-linked outer membrane protein [Aestuariibaculum sediminum]|uniref:TonB-dependent receptor n=1 Tax=Aestuariibaculum sediminum TaxID=2770637 RepID=A0A8J6QBF8_9FLAO|nr:TonB-dependent receptor [Aestuariibaculum sediminum]MBD0832926.1 TonB-dependent receptor [Aestuariibaculum sediminum]